MLKKLEEWVSQQMVQPFSTWHSAHLSSSPVLWYPGTDTDKMMWCFCLYFNGMSCRDPRNLPLKEYFNLCRWAHQSLPAEMRHLGLELCQYQHQNKCKSKSKLMCFPWGENWVALIVKLSVDDRILLSRAHGKQGVLKPLTEPGYKSQCLQMEKLN